MIRVKLPRRVCKRIPSRNEGKTHTLEDQCLPRIPAFWNGKFCRSSLVQSVPPLSHPSACDSLIELVAQNAEVISSSQSSPTEQDSAPPSLLAYQPCTNLRQQKILECENPPHAALANGRPYPFERGYC